LDLAELNRGRLIGNLERILLTIVVAAGSYAALGFLVAAKGLIRSEEFEKRDFTEYFLIGSLTSAHRTFCRPCDPLRSCGSLARTPNATNAILIRDGTQQNVFGN
jgi:hypothetical protein